MSETYNNFVFYKEWLDQLKVIAMGGTPEDLISLCDGLKEFLNGEELGEITPLARMLFNQMTAQIERDKGTYKEISEKRSEAGQKGARAKWDKAKDGKSMANDGKTWQTMANDGDKEEEEVDVSPDGDNTLSSTDTALALPAPQFVAETDPGKMSDRVLEEEFDALWRFYPRKAGKADALRHYKAARRKGVAYDTIEDGIRRYADYTQGQDPQYIAMGSTWFCGHRWEDQYVRKKSDLERLWDL